MNLSIFLPGGASDTLSSMAAQVAEGWLSGDPACAVTRLDPDGSRIPGDGGLLFCTEPDAAGPEPPGVRFLRNLAGIFSSRPPWYGHPGGILAYSRGNMFTKRTAQDVMFCLNAAGYMLPGKALVEGVGNLFNMRRLSNFLGSSARDAMMASCRALGERMAGAARTEFRLKDKKNEGPVILGVHSATSGRSNTLWAWKRIAAILEEGGAEVRTMSLDPEKIVECRGCAFNKCRHFGEKVSCFYGGQIPDEIFPAILQADALIILAPNYNDAPPANLSALLNRLSALYHADSAAFSRKTMGVVAVSGYSGSDCVIKTVMSALCLNKGFSLMPEGFFELLANDPGEAEAMGEIPGAAKFAVNLLGWLNQTSIS